jgi:serine/threonine-protein kinase
LASFEVGDLILGKYEVTRVLGRGGMGVVVAALHKELGELVALKFLKPSIRDNEAACQRFLREARTATRIKNEHVARVYDVGTADGTPFIVMEYLTGQDLAGEIRDRGPLPVAKAVDLLLQACEAVADAHKLGIVHRDLKPSNLFVTTGSDGMPFVKVIDFGISKSLTTSDPSVTASSAAVGSPKYMSPEQLACSRHVDQRSDVWSLGIVLYEMLTTETPFPGDSLAIVGAAILRGLYTRLSIHRSDVPAQLEQVVADALTRDLEKRLPSVHAFAARIAPFGSDAARSSLERIERISTRTPPASPDAIDLTVPDAPPSALQEAGLLPATTTGPPTASSAAESPRPSVRSRRWVAIAAATVATAVLATLGLLFREGAWRGGEPPTRAHGSGRHSAPAKQVQLAELAGACGSNVLLASQKAACRECTLQNCCSETKACESVLACDQLLGCYIGCATGDRKCMDACERDHPAGLRVLAPWEQCQSVNCWEQCE